MLTNLWRIKQGQYKHRAVSIFSLYNIWWLQGLKSHVKHVLLLDRLQQVQSWFNFLLRVVSLHSGAGDGDVLPLCCHVVCIRDHAHVDIYNIGQTLDIDFERLVLLMKLTESHSTDYDTLLPVCLTMLPVDLVLRDDDLAGVGVWGVLNGVV